MTVYGTCEKCGRLVADPAVPAFPVTGWEILRAGGGANAIHRRQRVPNRVRHSTCLPGGREDQGALFDSVKVKVSEL